MTMAEGDLAVSEIAFVREANIAPRPPPAAMTGVLGWLREKLLSTPFNIALTILIGLLFARAVVCLGHSGVAQIPADRRGVERHGPRRVP
jgi:hypothetical protein